MASSPVVFSQEALRLPHTKKRWTDGALILFSFPIDSNQRLFLGTLEMLPVSTMVQILCHVQQDMHGVLHVVFMANHRFGMQKVCLKTKTAT